ncbi:MAG: SPOR domain-containing protein [Proteobacteria bacterium]|nr:SPOR domain-containing protein [Pseudomonadota bacterium]
MARTAIVVGGLAGVSGCGVVPPIVSIASYAIDGFSLVASGKTLTDHAISVVAASDCALWRIFSTGPICVEDAQIAAADAAASPFVPAAPRQGRAGDGDGDADPILLAAPAPSASPPAATQPEPAKPATRVVGLHYLVLASFRDAKPAEQLADVHRNLGASLKEAEVDGKRWYRVVVGPAPIAQLVPVQKSMGGVGIERPWLVGAGEAVPAPNFTTLALNLNAGR